jgi:tetratricopeptide (TPR) repeat protein
MEALLKAGEVEQAKELAQAALEKNANDRAALVVLAKLALLDGDADGAETLITRATQGGKEDADSRLVRAALASERGDRDGARAIYEQIIDEAEPPRAEAHYGLGYLLASLDQYAEARRHLQTAVELEPEVAPYRFHLARVLLLLGELQLAIPHLEKALELNPTYPPIYMIWTEIMMQMGDAAAAQELLEKGLEALPGQPELLNMLGNVLAARGDMQSAFTIAQQLAQHFPDDAVAQGNYARMLMAVGHRQPALDLVRAMADNGMATVQTKQIEGMLLEAQEPPDVEGAVLAYREAMKLDPSDWAPANNLGNLLMRWEEGSVERNLKQAIEALEEARRREPSRVEPLLNLAIAHARAGTKDQAKALAREVLQRAPASARELKEVREQAERLLSTLG